MRNLSLVAESAPSAYQSTTLAPSESLRQDRSVQVQALIEGYRLHGYRAASINPLDSGLREFSSVAELDPRPYGFSLDDSLSYPNPFVGTAQTITLAELLARLRSSYCDSLVLSSAHIRDRVQRRWLYARMEGRAESSIPTEGDRVRLLGQLAAAEAFEHYLSAKYPEHKRFSLEGCDSLVPLLNTVIERAAHHGIDGIVLGMAHRGRLNVLKNVLDAPAKQLLSLFSGASDPALPAWDLKEHLGYSTFKRTAFGNVDILLAHNPSHLESVCPIVCGMARALQDRRVDGFSRKVMPVLVHGDSAFCGQGVVAETLNLSQTRGYHVGGTVHLILNNQIGSTVSNPKDSRSMLFCADIGRAIDAPIVHVNADDPDAVSFAAVLAADYRMRFGADIIVDLVGYRRYGHSGHDDPTMTQPAMQRRIRAHRSVVSLYADQLVRRGMVRDGELQRLKAAAVQAMDPASFGEQTPTATGTSPRSHWRKERQRKAVATAVPLSRLRRFLHRLTTVPPNFVLHAELDKLLERWRSIAGDDNRLVDWCLAENLAYASLLANGFNVRLSGLDVGRGSFFHRQAVWHHQARDSDEESAYVPLRHVADEQGYFSIFESPLSEEAVLGFEYGYAMQCGRDLVVWEAQLGDFVNNAQVIIDQYIATGEVKWGYSNGLVLLLPHGHEGAGPEHSSAFIARFLQLCAEDNMRVAMPSESSQLYHLLRRQALTDERKPLIVMTAKLRLHGQEESYSRLHHLAHGEFRPILRERVEVDAAKVVRAIVTSGKLYYDLANERTRANLEHTPILRLEQLYPFPNDALVAELARFPALRELVWAQEEAKNHGAWHLLRDQLETTLPPGVSLAYAGRPTAAASAVCDARRHAAEQQRVIATALGTMRA